MITTSKSNPKRFFVNSEMMLVGIDISKHKHSVYFCDFTGERKRKPFFITNNHDGFQYLLKEAEQQKRLWNLNEIVFGMEPTGSYVKPLQYFLEERCYQIQSINPLHTKRWKDIEDNHPSKNDLKDSIIITSLLRMGKSIHHRRPEGVFAELNNYAAYYHQLITDIRRQRNYLEASYACYFPELSNFFKFNSTGVMYIMECFPLPQDIVNAGYENFLKIMKTKSKGCIATEKLHSLYQVSLTSIGMSQGADSARVVINAIYEDISYKQYHLKQIKTAIMTCVDKISYGSLLVTIPGLSKVSVGLILAETGDINQYGRYQDLVKLAGLSLKHNQSGEYHGQYHISKVGRVRLRRILYMLTLEMIINNQLINQIYNYQVKKRGNNKVKTIVSLSSKLLGIMYSMVKYERSFDPEQRKLYAGYLTENNQ